jgi:hypothetical protein
LVDKDPALQASTDFITKHFNISGFDPNRLGIAPKQYVTDNKDLEAHLRLILLVKACATTEDFLHRYVHYWAIYKGFKGTKFNKLSEPGEAIIKPALASNIASLCKYVKDLMSVDLSNLVQTLGEAYQLRCVAAHSGGVVDASSARKLSFMGKLKPGDRIHLSWEKFSFYLNAIFKTCNIVEKAIPYTHLRAIEAMWILTEIVEASENITALQARRILIAEYGYHTGAPLKHIIAKEFTLLLE